MLNIIF